MRINISMKSKNQRIICICIGTVALIGIIVAILFIAFGHNKLASAYTKYNNGDYSGAIEEFDKLIAENDKSIDAYAGKALAQISSGDESGASDTIEKMATNCDDPAQWTKDRSQNTNADSHNTNTNTSNTNNEDVAQTDNHDSNNSSDNISSKSTNSNDDKNSESNFTSSDIADENTGEGVDFNPPVIDDPGNIPYDDIIREEYMWQFRHNVKIKKYEENEKLFDKLEKNGQNARYNIHTRPEQPTTDCPAGKYDQPITVNLNCVEGNTIRYRMEAGELAYGNSMLYEQAFHITKNHTTTNIVAATYDALYIPSVPLSLTYELERAALQMPTASKNSGEYTSKLSVSLTNPNDEGKIYYTTDGSEPTATSKEYSSAISVGEGLTNIKAKVIDSENDISSETLLLNYTVKIPKPTPAPTPKVEKKVISGPSAGTCKKCGGKMICPGGHTSALCTKCGWHRKLFAMDENGNDVSEATGSYTDISNTTFEFWD